jgi:hypothetical protein
MRRRYALVVVAAVAMVTTSLPAAAAGTSATNVFKAQVGDRTVANGVISITVPAYPTFLVGSVTSIVDFCGQGFPIYSEAEIRLAWKASSSAAPIADYTVTPLWAEGPGNPYATISPVVLAWPGNYDGSCGGGGDLYGWQITAIDTLGNAVTTEVDSWPNFTRFDNTTAAGPTEGTWSYSGTWAVSNCLCADGGRQTYSKQKNASASFAFNDLVLGRHVALVMAEGPGRGSAQVYLDGVLKATINTHASINTNRVITWDSGALTVGNHIVKIVNLATRGHPRIDVNAALTEGF